MALDFSDKPNEKSQKKSLFSDTVGIGRPLTDRANKLITPEDYLRSGNKDLIKQALDIISNDRKTHYYPILLELLPITSELRKDIIITLTDLGMVTAMPNILEYAFDENAETRKAVCYAASQLLITKSISIMNNKLYDDDEKVRFAALHALEALGLKFGFKSVAEHLLNALKEDRLFKEALRELLVLNDGSFDKEELKKINTATKDEKNAMIEKLLKYLKDPKPDPY